MAKDDEAKRFDAVIESAGRGGAYVVVPFDVEEAFGSKRPKIRATFDGQPYRGTLVRMGAPHHILPVLKAIRDRLGKQPGDRVSVTVTRDTEPRIVTVPDDFGAALKTNKEADRFFNGLSYTHRREYVQWIEGAKRSSTRSSRIEKAVSMLKNGLKAP